MTVRTPIPYRHLQRALARLVERAMRADVARGHSRIEKSERRLNGTALNALPHIIPFHRKDGKLISRK
jgi:hypothetical protein